MRKPVNFLITSGLLVGIFFLLKSYFPKYAELLPFFLVTVLLDLYLWYSVRKNILALRPVFRYPVTSLYWLSLILLFSLIIAGFLKPFIYWNIFLRTYLTAFIAIVYISKLFPIFFLFLHDILGLIRFIFRLIPEHGFPRISEDPVEKDQGKPLTHPNISARTIILGTGWIAGTFLFLLLVLGMIFWNFDFRVREHTIQLPELPSSFDGTRIVQISDIHLGSWGFPGKLKKAVRVINSLHPDIVFFTGDLVNYSSNEAYNFVNTLKEIRAPMGIFAIMGNHDYGEYVNWPAREAKIKNLLQLFEIYKYMGWKLLLNEHVFLYKESDSIAVIGVENWGGTRRFPRLGDIEKAANGTGNAQVKILLSHDPSHWDRIIKKSHPDIDITFSGHTHGFQFGIDCCGILWSPFSHLYREWAGVYTESVPGAHPQYLYINRGLGSIGYPGRVGILPEITLITLNR